MPSCALTLSTPTYKIYDHITYMYMYLVRYQT
jgi:hypothetical protein